MFRYLLLCSAAILLCQTIEALSTRQPNRRTFLCITPALIATTVSASIPPARAATTNANNLNTLLDQIIQARTQLESAVPSLIEQEKWDAVRAILIKPPVSTFWTNARSKSSASASILNQYIEALGSAGGDELAAMEAREDLVSHLRFLDMAVYNNVFNPIATEGKTGASKALIRSYYEDPMNEYKATVADLSTLIELGKELAK